MPYCAHCGAEVAGDATACPTCRRPLAVWNAPAPPPAPGAPPPPGAAPANRTSAVVWIVAGVGCLGALIVFGGIAAAIVIPNFLEALDKAKQKRTVADIRSVGVGLEQYRAEHGGVPAVASYEELEALLTPLPLALGESTDAWDHPLRYECTAPGGPTGCTSYRLASPGRDGEYELPSLADYAPEPFATTAYDSDIVYADGEFVQYPDGS